MHNKAFQARTDNLPDPQSEYAIEHGPEDGPVEGGLDAQGDDPDRQTVTPTEKTHDTGLDAPDQAGRPGGGRGFRQSEFGPPAKTAEASPAFERANHIKPGKTFFGNKEGGQHAAEAVSIEAPLDPGQSIQDLGHLLLEVSLRSPAVRPGILRSGSGGPDLFPPIEAPQRREDKADTQSRPIIGGDKMEGDRHQIPGQCQNKNQS